MARPEIVTVTPFMTRNTRLVVLGKLPLMARLVGPGPLMLRSLVMTNWPLVRVIVPVTPVASMVSPFAAPASAARNDPAPLSAVLLTVIVAALRMMEPAHSSAGTNAAEQA